MKMMIKKGTTITGGLKLFFFQDFSMLFRDGIYVGMNIVFFLETINLEIMRFSFMQADRLGPYATAKTKVFHIYYKYDYEQLEKFIVYNTYYIKNIMKEVFVGKTVIIKFHSYLEIEEENDGNKIIIGRAITEFRIG
jgi:hypothetical protein